MDEITPVNFILGID